jgi:hypothetical protein
MQVNENGVERERINSFSDVTVASGISHGHAFAADLLRHPSLSGNARPAGTGQLEVAWV